MPDCRWKPGMLVVHANCPDWGPGKVVHVHGSTVHVVFRDLPLRKAKALDTTIAKLLPAESQHDDILDNLPSLIERSGGFFLPAERMTFKQAVNTFLAKYPQGFDDQGYLGDAHSGERYYKWKAHEAFCAMLGGQQLRQLLQSDLPVVIERALKCVNMTNLLYVTEKAALKDALMDANAARRFFTRLADLLEAPSVNSKVFEAYAEAVVDLPAERGKVATWPVATMLPFLAQPSRNMFLKPQITKKAADRLAFNLDYRPEPNWITYECLLRMSDVYLRKLGFLSPRDLIDVQSFFWVTAGA
jgi:hypothetical protein